MLNFEKHNEEVKRIMEAFNAGKPIRVPIVFNTNPGMMLLDPKLNKWGYTFKDYFDKPEVMREVQLSFQRWVRFNIPQDREMGLPEKEWAGINFDAQNTLEAQWFGCKVVLSSGWPRIIPLLQENKRKLYDLRIPDPVRDGIMKKACEFYEYFEEKRHHEDFMGKPVGKSSMDGIRTDGPFTVAVSLRGVTELCTDIYEDPKYVHDLLDFITTATIIRIKAVSRFTKTNFPVQEWEFADDSIELLSDEMYKEFVLPYHKRLVKTFSKGGPNSIHLCGKAQHHFKTLKEELNIGTFDTGFPTDLARARKELGPDVLLRGNIHPELLRSGPKKKIVEAVKNLLSSGVMEGGKFILCEGNQVVPGTPIKHFEVMYEAGKKFGRYFKN